MSTSPVTSRALNRHLRQFHPRTGGVAAVGGGGFAASTLGCFIHLVATPGQTIPSGGALLEFNTFETLQSNNWDTQIPTFPADEIGIPLTRYYDILVAFRWDTWDNGGTVIINRTRGGVSTPVWPPVSDAIVGRWSSDLSGTPVFIGIAKGIPMETADTISVSVDSGDSGDQDILGGYMTIESIEEGGPEVAQDIFIFTEDGTFDWDLAGSPSTLRDVWIFGGGGGGAGSNSDTNNWKPGGGGAGGLLHLTDYPVSGNVTVIVGAGGNGGHTGGASSTTTPGEDSSFDGQVAEGGGKGAVGTTEPGGGGSISGGCGGGATTAGSITSGVGGDGSQGGDGGDASTANNAGGGGGGVGGDGQDGQSGSNGGDGGPGIDLSAIVGLGYGDNGWFGGGGGGNGSSSGGTGGQGGGGDGVGGTTGAGEDAIANSAGGGGAGGYEGGGEGGNGGSGIVIVRVR